MNSLIPLFVILPLAAAFLTPLVSRFLGFFPKSISLLVYATLVILSILYFRGFGETTLLYKAGGWEPVNGVPIAIYLVLDGFSALMLLIINFIAFFCTLYSISYIKKFTAEPNFYVLLCLMVAGMNGVVLSGDLFNLYVFLEVASIASYALVAFGVEKEELEASFKYQVLGGIASLIILLGIGLVYWTTSTLNIDDVSQIIQGYSGNKIALFIQIMFIVGFGLKAAMVPFHAWLPDAHSSAPSPISSMLSGVLIKAGGVYVLIRLFFNMFSITYEIALTITTLGVLSMLIGGILAIGQWDYKRLLAYSSISQVGYISIGMGIGMMVLATNANRDIAALALFGGLFHMINHAVGKGLLFMTAGSVEYATGIRDLNKLGGLIKKMPITSSASFGGSMSISGLPPFSGFFSKLVIIIAAIQAHYYLVAFLAAGMSIVTLSYFLRLQKNLFTVKPKSEIEQVKEVPFAMSFSMVFLGVMCIALSLLIIPDLREAVITPAVNALFENSNYPVTILK